MAHIDRTFAAPSEPRIQLRASDSSRLEQLAEAAADKFPATADFLAREVARAAVVPDPQLPAEVVCMDAAVTYRDETTGLSRDVILTYPEEADLAAGRISVLTPIGAALIGLTRGHTIAFETPAGHRKLTVTAVRQPHP